MLADRICCREQNFTAETLSLQLPASPQQPWLLKTRDERVAQFRDENDWKNDIILYFVPSQLT